MALRSTLPGICDDKHRALDQDLHLSRQQEQIAVAYQVRIHLAALGEIEKGCSFLFQHEAAHSKQQV